MNRSLIFIAFTVNFLFVKSYVVTLKKSDTTTPSQVDNRAQNVYANKTSEKKVFQKNTFDINESHVYLEDVFYSIKNQNWTKEEQPCLNKTLVLLRNLQNYTLWAVWTWDSVSSEPQGLLFGGRYELGNFDECMNMPWYETHPDLRTQYCLADIVLERTDKAVRKRTLDPYDPQQSALNLIESQTVFRRPLNQLTWGVCVPAACGPRSVEKQLGTLLAHSHLGTARLRARISINDKCQQAGDPRPFDALFYSFIGVIAAFSAVVLICTWVKSRIKKPAEMSVSNALISAFDIKHNAKRLFLVKKETEVLYGIKFLTMCLIVISHQYGIFNSGPISNGYQVDKDAASLPGIFLLHNDIVVDTFFTLSGFLSATYITKMTNFGISWYIILRRYCRLVVAYALILFYIVAVHPYLGSGPLWNRAVDNETDPCRKNWWLNLLMVSNYIDTENMCLVISWYIPCDFHFFVFTLLLFWIYKRSPTIGQVLFVVVGFASVVIPGVINYLNKLPAIQAFTYDFISNPRGPKQFHVSYIKSHTRYAPYFVGFMGGYIFTHRCHNASGDLNTMPRKWSTIGAYVSLVMMAVTEFTGPLLMWKNYNALESAVYAALNRPVWAVCLTAIIMCCSMGHVPIVKGFLSWRPWVPLSSLTYGIYLIHSLLISRNVFVTRNPHHNDYFTVSTQMVGILFWSTLIAFLMWLLAEAPMNNVVTMYTKLRKPRTKEKSHENQNSPDNITEIKPEESGNLQENLPVTIHVLSSKI